MADERLRNVMSLFLLVVVFVVITQAADPTVTISGGKLQGSILKSAKGRNFYAFRGVPYAEPPVGDLRFKYPVPKSSWKDETLDATKDGAICTQLQLGSNKLLGQEDCLFINVYTQELPDNEENADKVVMVFIHGGGYIGGDGTSETYSPVILMDSDIVLVTLNYRLGAFGFLSTGDAAAPGNYAMLDQNLALRWVQENIKYFGGDPTKVTIFGESVGSGSVSHHLVSPLSKGLFRAAISMSGSTTCSWAVNDDVLYWARRLANDLNCPNTTSQELVDCLRNVPAENISQVTNTFPKASFFPLPFTPRVDGYFLPEYPLVLLHAGKVNHVPVMSGITNKEGGFFMNHILLGRSASAVLTPEYQNTIIDYSFTSFRPLKDVSKLVKEEYFSDVDPNNAEQAEDTIVNAYSEGLFDSCHFETITLLAKAGLPSYAYIFQYFGTYAYADLLGVKVDRRWGASHGDDLYMLFPFPGKTLSEQDKPRSATMVKLWTNFAIHGTPVLENDSSLPQWPRIQGNIVPEYHLNDTITVETFNIAEDSIYNFWRGPVRNARIKDTLILKKEEHEIN